MNRVYLARQTGKAKYESLYNDIAEMCPHLGDKAKRFMKAYLDKIITKEEYENLKYWYL